MKKYAISLTPAADRDLDDLHRYVAQRETLAEANRIVASILDTVETLATFAERGSVPHELDAVGNRRYRQLLHLPYRIIYRRSGTVVVVYLIADGRRDMRTLLRHRLHSF